MEVDWMEVHTVEPAAVGAAEMEEKTSRNLHMSRGTKLAYSHNTSTIQCNMWCTQSIAESTHRHQGTSRSRRMEAEVGGSRGVVPTGGMGTEMGVAEVMGVVTVAKLMGSV